MRIDELIEELEAVKEEHGNLEIQELSCHKKELIFQIEYIHTEGEPLGGETPDDISYKSKKY